MAQSFFEINTKGTCLFCISPNCAPLDRNKLDLTTSTALKMLFRYLHIDIRKLVNNVSLGSSSNLAVSLCDACFFLIDEFLELFQDFERIRLQLEGCTWKLHEFIRNGNKNGDRVREYQKRVMTSGGEEDELHANFVEKLRMETSEKCSKRRGPSIPKISLRRDALDLVENSSGIGTDVMAIDSKFVFETINIESLPVKIEMDDDDCAEASYETPDSPTSSISMKPTSNIKYDEQSETKKLFIRNPGLTKLHHRNNHVGNKFQSQPKKGRTQKCVYCSRYFSYQSTLNAHQFLVHPVQMLSKHLPPGVSEYDVKAAVDRILASGKVATKKGAKLTCPVCHQLFASEVAKLKLHVLRCHKDHVSRSIYQIRQPQVMTPSSAVEVELAEIIQEKVNQQITNTPSTSAFKQISKYNNACEICGKMFSCMMSMDRHKNRFHRNWSFKCDLCSRLFVYDKTLQRHLQEFHAKKPVATANANSTAWSCDYCDKAYPFRNGLQHHLHVKHFMQLYGARIPPEISEHVFESTVAVIVEKILAPVEARNRAFQRSPCVFCGKALLCASNPYVRVHLLRYHLEEVIESAEKAIMVKKGSATATNDSNNTAASLFVPCKSEYPPVTSIQVEDDEDWSRFELEGDGEEHPLADEDPLGI